MRTTKRPRIKPVVSDNTHYHRVVKKLSEIYNITEREIQKIYRAMKYDLRSTKAILNLLSYEPQTT